MRFGFLRGRPRGTAQNTPIRNKQGKTGSQLFGALLMLLIFVGSALGSGFQALAAINELQVQQAQNPDEAKKASVNTNAQSLVIPLKTLGDPDGYTLKTVKTERLYYFTRPQGWGIKPSSHIRVTFQHSPSLLPERSSLNVKVNNRILKTIALGKDNVATNTVTIPVPPELLKDQNTLSFQVDQHYTYQCEDPFSEELWTTLLPETQLQLDYDLLRAKTDLARFPYPMYDPLGYGETVVYLAANPAMSSESLSATAIAAAGISHYAGWRAFRIELIDPSQAGSVNGNVVVVGTPEENSAVSRFSSGMAKSPSSLNPGEGVIGFFPNPSYPSKAVLVLSGKDPKGVLAASSTLFQQPVSKILSGNLGVVKEYSEGLPHPYRAWDGFIQKSGTTFAKLGFKTESTRGITATPLFYKIKLMPDLFLPGRTKSKLKTVYSYSSQIDPKMSKLEIRWNGRALKSVPLDNPDGEFQKTLELDIPSEELFTYNDLEYQFFLFPDKHDLCNFVTDVHIWGTLHNTSSMEFPGDIRTPLPDVGLLNDGAFPFTAYPDMAQTAFVLPDNPTEDHLKTMVKLLTRMGRLSTSQTGFRVKAFRANQLPGDVKGGSHLIVIGNEKENSLFKEVPAKTKMLVLEGDKGNLQGNDKKLATLAHDASQGILEEVLSPWNSGRVVLLVYGQTAEAYNRIQTLFDQDPVFGEIQPGNLVVVNADGHPQSVTALKKGEARFFYEDDLTEGWKMPIWGWILLCFFALLGVVGFLRFLFGR